MKNFKNSTPKEELITESLHPNSKKQVGDIYRVHAGAPGIGYWDYKITRIDDTGVYGYLIEDTIRVLEPWECE